MCDLAIGQNMVIIASQKTHATELETYGFIQITRTKRGPNSNIPTSICEERILQLKRMTQPYLIIIRLNFWSHSLEPVRVNCQPNGDLTFRALYV